MQKRVARIFSHIITVSKRSANDISREFKVPARKFRIIFNGIDTNLFYPIPEIKRENNRIIVTNSADTPLKGLYYLLKAVAAISKTQHIRLVVVGTPKKNGGIEKLINDLGIGRSVIFTGRIDHEEFVRQYAKATIAVVPSVYEGFGLPAGEAMACAVPVISTSGGALPEVVGDAGILVPPQNDAALARAIMELIDNPQRAYTLGQLGMKRIQEHFSWKKAAEKTVGVYREAIYDFNRF